MEKMRSLITLWIASLMMSPTEEGFDHGPPDPAKLLTALYGPPCDCEGGTSLAQSQVSPMEKCCFYANKSGIVRAGIKKHQEELEKRRRKLFDRPLLELLERDPPLSPPLLGPLLGLLILLSLGPLLFNKLMGFIKAQIDSLASKPIQVHYQRLDLADRNIAEP